LTLTTPKRGSEGRDRGFFFSNRTGEKTSLIHRENARFLQAQRHGPSVSELGQKEKTVFYGKIIHDDEILIRFVFPLWLSSRMSFTSGNAQSRATCTETL
jgi:hypothetical protein